MISLALIIYRYIVCYKKSCYIRVKFCNAILVSNVTSIKYNVSIYGMCSVVFYNLWHIKKPLLRGESDYKFLITKQFYDEKTSIMEIGGSNAANDVAVIQCFCPKTSDFG